jgi:hypothetical protein
MGFISEKEDISFRRRVIERMLLRVREWACRRSGVSLQEKGRLVREVKQWWREDVREESVGGVIVFVA